MKIKNESVSMSLNLVKAELNLDGYTTKGGEDHALLSIGDDTIPSAEIYLTPEQCRVFAQKLNQVAETIERGNCSRY